MDIADRAFEREEEIRQDALSAMDLHPNGLPSLSHCEFCGHHIPLKRQEAILGVSTCITCQDKLEAAMTPRRTR